jgi:hypothetical protein
MALPPSGGTGDGQIRGETEMPEDSTNDRRLLDEGNEAQTTAGIMFRLDGADTSLYLVGRVWCADASCRRQLDTSYGRIRPHDSVGVAGISRREPEQLRGA